MYTVLYVQFVFTDCRVHNKSQKCVDVLCVPTADYVYVIVDRAGDRELLNAHISMKQQ